MACRGLWIPSKMPPKIPGPSSTESGFPVLSTGSPTVTPAVVRNVLNYTLSFEQWKINWFSLNRTYKYPRKLAG